ncbi:hypothetical protein ambt_19235 [Alteromonas naphthalenivorans]|uniref:Uncharacterized protein n=1 Tax=Alteromonas naphthalenivorans TaxID=715451 RepID=F5ZFP9_ALTNA|nr:hypothetical protein ambt_19235 [Alteromonas naphthalenivorans]
MPWEVFCILLDDCANGEEDINVVDRTKAKKTLFILNIS